MGFGLGTLGKIAGGVGGFMLGGPAGAMAGYSLGSALGGHGGGGEDPMSAAANEYGGYAKQSRNRFLDALSSAPDAVNRTTKAAVAGALPGYLQNLQGTKENAIRRGASNGDLETSYEGDLSSAFQRNVANAAAGQATNVLGQQLSGYGAMAGNDSNNYLDLLSGNRDAKQSQQNNWFGLGAGLLGAAGQVAGAYYGAGR